MVLRRPEIPLTLGSMKLTGDPEKLKRMAKNIPAGRLARSEESARLAVSLASEDADFFVGQVIPFAGGWVTP